MRDVGGGDLSRRIPVDTVDEIGRAVAGVQRHARTAVPGRRRRFAPSTSAWPTRSRRPRSICRERTPTLGPAQPTADDMRRELGDKERLATLGQLAAQLAHEIGTPLGLGVGPLAAGARCSATCRRRLRSACRWRRASSSASARSCATTSIPPARSSRSASRPTSAALLDEAVEIVQGVERRDGRRRRAGRPTPARATSSPIPGCCGRSWSTCLTNAARRRRQAAASGRVTRRRASQSARTRSSPSATTARASPPRTCGAIFEPFYTTKGRGKGTGLGLAICRELAPRSAARISVESPPGAGSTFTVRLPRQRTADARPTRRPAARRRSGRRA